MVDRWSVERVARELLDAHGWGPDSACWEVGKRVMDLEEEERRSQDAFWTEVERTIRELAKVGPNPTRIRVRTTYERCRDYLPGHIVEREDEEGVIVLVHPDWATWTSERLHSGLVGNEILGERR